MKYTGYEPLSVSADDVLSLGTRQDPEQRIAELEREACAVTAERNRAQQACEVMGRRIVELRDALGRTIDYCDAATHGDGQYADERSALLRAWRGDDSGSAG